MKTVKAKCQITGKTLIMQVSDDGKEVLGYYRTDDASYAAMQSEVRLANATYRVACATCGSKAVGGCEHKYQRVHCDRSALPDKECVTCRYMVPDYGRATRSDVVQIHAGEVAALELNHLRVGVNWDSLLDIDSSVIMCGDDDGELVYYGELESRDGSVVHLGDNLTGEEGEVEGADDDENIDVTLDEVDEAYDRLIFVINIFSGAETFRDVRGLKLCIYDSDSNSKLVEYEVSGNYRRYSSLIIGEARRTQNGWEFLAIGEGSELDDLDDLVEYCMEKHW